MKLFFRFRVAFAFVLLCLLASESRAQNPDASAREAEWQAYKLPSSNFIRYTDPTRALIFRVPAEWKRQGSELSFAGPDVELRVVLETIPDGIPLRSYIAAMAQGLRSLPGGADAVRVRRTQMCGVEARELMFELADASGTTQRIIWTAVDGPRAVSFVFVAPVALAPQVQPYFKAVVQSAMLSVGVTSGAFHFTFPGKVKENEPARIDEVLGLVESLDSIDTAARAKAISGLAQVFANSPEAAIDLLKDRRSMIRVAAIEAIEMSSNAKLEGFLIEALNDRDSFVAERAAKAFAVLNPGFGKTLLNDVSNWRLWGFQRILRASEFLDEATRAQIAAALFKPSTQTKFTLLPPIVAPAPKSAPAPLTGLVAAFDFQNDDIMLALNLLRNISASHFKMPLADIIARKNDKVIAAALQVALERNERLPVDALLKLLASPSEEARWLAAWNLASSASTADVARIEPLIEKLSAESKDAESDKSNKRLAGELRVAIKKIRLREQIAAADGESRSQLIKQALSDAALAAWAWVQYARDETQGPTKKDAAAIAPTIEVMPFGENAFPENVTHYVALPDPSSALKKITDGLRGLQMESARSQADLVLILSTIRERLAQTLDVPPDGALLDYLGIKSNSPVAIASWNAESAPRSVAIAQRQAMVLRVSDRDRFERLLALYQKQLGSFAWLPNYVSIGARVMSIAPAVLPFSAAAILREGVRKPEDSFKSECNLIRRATCLGHPVKIIERREINSEGRITSDSIHLAYVGNAAVLAPDFASLRDVLARLASNGAKLSTNAEFKRAVEMGGEAIYFSSLTELFDSAPAKTDGGEILRATESGSLRISNSSWENSFQFSFKESAWAKPLVRFHPSELSAPRDLLPRSTIIYYLMKAEAASLWREWVNPIFSAERLKQFASAWAMDFEKEVLAEIGPECGLALLGLPDFNNAEFNVPWVIFFKLKSDKINEALGEGKLLKSVSANSRAPHIQLAGLDAVLTVKNGFLIVASNEAALARLDLKEKLDRARDFARAAKSTPAGVVAFGGYNLEAAIAEIKIPSNDPMTAQAVGSLMSMASAFHSQNFYATESAGHLDARMSVSLDREGRYSVEELSKLAKDYRLTFAIIEAGGIPIVDQKRLESLKLRIRTKAAGAIDRIKEDVTRAGQEAAKRSEEEMILTVRPRRFARTDKIQLPVSGAEFAEFLKPSSDIKSDDKSVIERAREIAGDDRDAWSVARKLSDWTYKNLKWKRVDYADAAQTLATREADCTEFSQLFVAMARALGLPARMVTGFAYSDGSFGGHAWVEVYAGEWIELDPTFGTDFVDATHIRESSRELIGYAVLNLVQIEALEATRTVLDYQRDASRLAEKLCEDLNSKEQNALAAALDVAALTDEYMGAGSWDKMNEREREQISAAYQRTLAEISNTFDTNEDPDEGLRLLKVKSAGDRAEAILMQSIYDEALVKFEFARRGDVWVLTELIQSDTGLRMISSRLQPAIQEILDKRSGKKTTGKPAAAFERELLTLVDFQAVIKLADEALKGDPKNRNLRYIKSLALRTVEKNEEAVKLLTELSQEAPPFAPAIYQLAAYYELSNVATDHKRAIELYERYATLEPDDPRAHSSLAALYQQEGDKARAEAKYIAAIERDPQNTSRHLDLAVFLSSAQRYAEALAAMDKADSTSETKDALYQELLARLFDSKEYETAEALVAAHPERLEKDFGAVIVLANMRVATGRAKEALPLFKKASELEPQSPHPHTGMAEAYRKLKNWSAALAAADAALKINEEDFRAHINRACALARLGRKQEAIRALKSARELQIGSVVFDYIEDEEDLKPLAGLAEFKALFKKKDDK